MISLTNLNAMRSAAAMAESNADIKTSMERLSTGSRINSASDDAAGLAIATEMNTQIVGMAKALDNAADGANLMSTADGAWDWVGPDELVACSDTSSFATGTPPTEVVPNTFEQCIELGLNTNIRSAVLEERFDPAIVF